MHVFYLVVQRLQSILLVANNINSMSVFAITILVNAVTQLFKRFLMPRYGATGVHVLLFVSSFAVAFYVSYADHFPEIKHVMLVAVEFFCLAMSFYEVFLSRFSKLFDSTIKE